MPCTEYNYNFKFFFRLEYYTAIKLQESKKNILFRVHVEMLKSYFIIIILIFIVNVFLAHVQIWANDPPRFYNSYFLVIVLESLKHYRVDQFLCIYVDRMKVFSKTTLSID